MVQMKLRVRLHWQHSLKSTPIQPFPYDFAFQQDLQVFRFRGDNQFTMIPEFGQADLDCEIVFERVLGRADLDTLQQVLARLAPKWSTRLRVWRGPCDQRPIDLADPAALGRMVLAAVGERGPTYRQLVREYGPGPFERMSGSAELRGAGPELVVIVSVDAFVVSTLGTRTLLGNAVDLQLRRATIAGQPGREWLAKAFETLCALLSPAWGYAGHPSEYWAKVMSVFPRIEAVGRDFGRHLPGVFWINFFGHRYADLIGPDRFRLLPAGLVAAVNGGTLVRIGDDPLAWGTSSYAIEEGKIRDYLGRDFFNERV